MRVRVQPATQHFHYVAVNSDIARENSVPTMASQSVSSYTVLPPVGSAREVFVLSTNSIQKKMDGVLYTVFQKTYDFTANVADCLLMLIEDDL